MKVKQFAAEKGITRQAVYSSISKKGYQISQLTDSSGNLTNEGLTILNGIFKGTAKNRDTDNLLSQVKQLENVVHEQKETIESQRKTIEEQAGTISSLTESIDRLSKMADRESVNVSQAQQITAMMKISREPILKRLFAGKKEQT